jgi:DNA-binding LytR/AlgR family response regulator
MEKIRAIIAEDEENLRRHLRERLLSLWPELVIHGEAGDGISALSLIEDLGPDVAFLDIKMPGLSGIEVARKAAGKCLTVFITAHDKYAVEAFENEAVDYLLKPIADERLEKMVERLKNKLSSPALHLREMSKLMEKIAPDVLKRPEYLQWIKTQYKDGIRLISVREIYFFKAMDKYTAVRTNEGEFLIRKTIRELADELDPNQFWRIHRATIVNVKNIFKVERSLTGRYQIRFSDLREQLTVSRAYSHLFKTM